MARRGKEADYAQSKFDLIMLRKVAHGELGVVFLRLETDILHVI